MLHPGHCDDIEQWMLYRYETWLDSVVKTHPCLGRFLDPSCLYIEAVGPLPPALPAILATLPGPPHGLTGAVVAAPAPGVPAGSSNIYVCPGIRDAQMACVALRTHFANPAGGGGTGPNCIISRFNTQPAGFLYV